MECNGTDIQSSQVNLTLVNRASFCLGFDKVDLATLGGKHCFISSENKKYFIWFNDGNDVAPTVANATAIEVGFSVTEPVRALVIACETAVKAVNEFQVKRNGNSLACEVLKVGEAYDVADKGTSDVEVVNHCKGYSLDLGLLEGDVEISTEAETSEITAHQTGTNPVDEFVTKRTVSLSTTLLEFNGARKEKLLEILGGKHTDSNGNELRGFGTGQNGKSLRRVAGTLLVEPVDGSDEGKKVIWKALPKLSSILHAQEGAKKATIEWSSLVDNNKPKEIDVIAFGKYEDLLNGVAQ